MPWRRHSPLEGCYQSLDTAKSLQSSSQPWTMLPGSLLPLTPESLGDKAGIKAVPQLPFGVCRQSALMSPKTPLSIRNPTCFAPQKPPRWSPMAYFMDCHKLYATHFRNYWSLQYTSHLLSLQLIWIKGNLPISVSLYFLPPFDPHNERGRGR